MSNTVIRKWAGINMLARLSTALQAVPLHRLEIRANRERIDIGGRAGHIVIEQGMLEDRAVTVTTYHLIGTAAYIMYGLTVEQVFEDANELLR
jgi:hypothetical protein